MRFQLEDWQNLHEQVESIKHDFEVRVLGEFEYQFSDLKAFPRAIRSLATEMLNRIYQLEDHFNKLTSMIGEEVAERETAER